MQSASKHARSGSAVVASNTAANPEGKGLNGFLLDVHLSEPKGVVAKPHRQVLAELFTSLLVLSATFKYRPAVGTLNYLYRINGEWLLSLIAPYEWSDERRAGFAGTCVLHRDMTWTITPSPLLAEKDNPVADALARFHAAFAAMLDTDLALTEILPFHVGRLPYYQRLYAYALSRSVSAAVMLGGQTSTSCRHWRMLLPREQTRLLACGA